MAELRGSCEWERISWDEALDLIAGEIERILDTYGNEGILLPGGVPQRMGDVEIGRLMYIKADAWSRLAQCHLGHGRRWQSSLACRRSRMIAWI